MCCIFYPLFLCNLNEEGLLICYIYHFCGKSDCKKQVCTTILSNRMGDTSLYSGILSHEQYWVLQTSVKGTMKGPVVNADFSYYSKINSASSQLLLEKFYTLK